VRALLGIGILLAMSLDAAAAEQVVNFASLKLNAHNGKLVISAADPSIPFLDDTADFPPSEIGLSVRIHTKDYPDGIAFSAEPNWDGQVADWVFKSGSVGKWTFSDHDRHANAVRKLSLREDGRLKAVIVGAAALMPSSAAPVYVLVDSLLASGYWAICARFEADDFVKLLPGQKLQLGASTGSFHLTQCTAPIYEGCGDGEIDPGEVCDDYNAASGDGCSSTCTLEVCGDGVLNPQEDCDDGNNDSGDGCPANCAICGSNKVAGDEDCDPPYSIGGERLCRGDCSLAVCGDGVVEAGENCEPTRGLDAACPGQCGAGGVLACSCPGTCGNGVIDGAESCDPAASNSTWNCGDTGGYLQPISCSGNCHCCNDACGLGGLGCCGPATGCLPSPGGFGSCVAPARCIINDGCSDGLVCNQSTNSCCITGGDIQHWCRALGVSLSPCCPGLSCVDDGTFGYCQ